VARQDYFCLEFLGAAQGGVKVFHFEPQQHAISMGQFWVADAPVMMSNVPVVQLHQQLTIRNQLFVMASAVAALAPEQTLVPATARFNVPNANQRLWAHLLFAGAQRR
jgi:hypothetical protein